jgi:di/tricarboxylate transporter
MNIDVMHRISLAAIVVLPVFVLLCIYFSGDSGRKRIGNASLAFLGAGESRSKSYMVWRVAVAVVLLSVLIVKIVRVFTN